MAYLDYDGSTQASVALLDKIKPMLSEIYTTTVPGIEDDIALLGNAELPGQTGNSGKFLTTDGSATSWGTPDGLPEQSGNSGKFLSTNGTDPTWTAFSGLTFSECILTESKYNQIADASASGTHTFDYSNGDMQQVTATGDVTISFSNFPTGKVASFIIDAINWGAHEVTYPAGMTFAQGVAPTYTTSGTDRLVVLKDKDDVYEISVKSYDMGVES